jgi:hypothetical protein
MKKDFGKIYTHLPYPPFSRGGEQFFISLLLFCFCTAVWAENTQPAVAEPLYQNNFQQEKLDQAPGNVMVLSGEFTVKQEGDNKFLELPGAPLETFSTLFGPTENENIAASARIFGTAKGRRSPTFGIGLNGVSGYVLRVAPQKKELELVKDEQVLASATFEWKSGVWTHFRLQIRKVKDDEWKVEGKAWMEGSEEPKNWAIAFDLKEKPTPGRASIWGAPYTGTPIRFDDLMVMSVITPP